MAEIIPKDNLRNSETDPQKEPAHPDHGITIGQTTYDVTNENPRDYYKMMALARAGMVSGVVQSEDDDELTRQQTRWQRENEQAMILNMLADAISDAIDQLQDEIDGLFEHRKELVEEEKILEEHAANLDEKIEEKKQEVAALETAATADQEVVDTKKQEALTCSVEAHKRLEALADKGLPGNILTIKHEEIHGGFVYDLELAVNYDEKTSKYSYISPDGKTIVITDAEQIKKLDGERNNIDPAKSKISANEVSPFEARRIHEYTQLAGEFIKLDVEKNQKLAELNDAKSKLGETEKFIAEKREKLRQLVVERAETAQKIKDIQKEVAKTDAEITLKQAKLAELQKRQQEITAQKKLVMAEIHKGYKPGELKDMQADVKEAQSDYNQASKSADEIYDNAMTKLGIADAKYNKANAILDKSGIMMIGRDCENAHLKFAVHNDAKGYYYEGVDGKRHTISPKEIAKLREQGGKTVEELAGNKEVQLAVHASKEAGKNVEEAVKVLTSAPPGVGGAAEPHALAAAGLDHIMAQHPMIGPPTEKTAQFDTVESRMMGLVNNGRQITRQDMDKALESADPSYREQFEKELLHKQNVAVIDKPHSPIFSGITPQAVEPLNLNGVPQGIAYVHAAAETIDPTASKNTPLFNNESLQGVLQSPDADFNVTASVTNKISPISTKAGS